MNVKLIWATPDCDQILAKIARVSNPHNQDNPKIEGLLRYMMREGHVSPFEMANAVMEIATTRDIARQILRHRSFSFQEFSQRYQSVNVLADAGLRECRLQDEKNRQNSIELDLQQDEQRILAYQWEQMQKRLLDQVGEAYNWALDKGIAKEQARVVLPEGLTSSKMYMNGTLRSWIFYLQQRLHPSTQKEHRLVAEQVLAQLRVVAPVTMGAFFPE